jgi:light-harvesting complex 1 beta chain
MNIVQAKQQVVSVVTVPKEDRKAFFVIFAPAFVVFLAIALVGQTLGMQWRSWLPGAESVKSVTGGVKAAVYTFMSHLQ